MTASSSERLVPSVALANYAPFHKGKAVSLTRVHSRMMLWCCAGSGTVTINRHHYTVHPDAYFIIPWGHSIKYEADVKHPFLLSGIHIVHHSQSKPPTRFGVRHEPNDPPSQDMRHYVDKHIQGLDDVFTGRFRSNMPMRSLAQYIIQWAIEQPRRGHNTDTATSLASLLIEEWKNALHNQPPSSPAIPGKVQRMLKFIESNLGNRIRVQDLASAGICSSASVYRLFARHLDKSPVAWIRECRMRRAAELITSSQLPMHEIGRRVGIDDPYYFSRLFRKHQGITARQYRLERSLL